MKKITNAPVDVIEDYISGLVSATPHLARIEDWSVVVRSPATRKSPDRVSLISGGGSGHEPAHAGFVGTGMLDAAVLGPVFTSPSVDAVYAAIAATATDAGVLLIVKNYTGDRLNFGLAAEQARANGIRVEMVVVADDAALGDSPGAGRRGLTSTVLVHKVAGAAAERGWPIERILATVARLLERSATMGIALGPNHVPGAEVANFELGANEVEWGLGIHGEPGQRRGELLDARGIAGELVNRVVTDRALVAGDPVAVLINSLGGTADLELRILQGEVLTELSRRGLVPRLTWAGAYLTSLDMPGASLTVAAVDDELVELLRDEALVAAFPRSTDLLEPGRAVTVTAPHAVPTVENLGAPVPAAEAAHRVVSALAATLIDAEAVLTDLDRKVGDGDLGTNLARGARAVLAATDALVTQSDTSAYLRSVADIVRQYVGGTSGPLYAILLLGMSNALREIADPQLRDLSEALGAGVEQVRRVGGAAPGQRTMVDALVPGAAALGAGSADPLRAAAQAARAGADATADLSPSLGRSSYVGDRALGIPDPGAVAIALLFERLAEI